MKLAMLGAAVAVVSIGSANNLPVARVEMMPNHPRPYAMRDWAKVARDFDAFAFDDTKRGEYLPLIWWDHTHHNFNFPGFGMPSYVGRPTQTHGDQHESICCMAAVVGASLVGINKSDQGGHDFVRMCERYFNRDSGLGLYLNNCEGATGGSFWYETYPSIIFAQLYSLYPDTPGMLGQMRTSADRMCEAIAVLGGDKGVPNFNHTAFSYEKMKPVDNGRWTEPDAAAAYAWFEYMTYAKTGDAKYLAAADKCLRFLDGFHTDPLYECLLWYGATVAARMNAEQGRHYDVRRLVNWCFGPTTQVRRGWGVVVGKWGGADVSGLTGSTPDGYAFCMDTFDEIAALAPLARYDHRFARAIGKYILNAANASRFFYPEALDDDAQTSAAWARRYDPASCIAYEGVRRRGRATATPDADVSTACGKIVEGDFSACRCIREVGGRKCEVLEEGRRGDGYALDHVWRLRLKPNHGGWVGASAHGEGGSFRLSWATSAAGPWSPLFTVEASADDRMYGTGITMAPAATSLYVRAESASASARPARLSVDVLWYVYDFDSKSPYGMGDVTTGSPPYGGATDLGLYGSAHVGYLGGIVSTTNVPEILRIDLLKTDWFHGPAYPTYLYFNPYDRAKSVAIDVGPKSRDLYDAVSDKFLARGAKGTARVAVPANSAAVVVLAPSGGKLKWEGNRVTIGGIAVNYCLPALVIHSPKPDAWVKGRMPVSMKADPCGGDPITRVRATLDERQVYTGGGVPKSLAIDTSRYPDGRHVLAVRVVARSGGSDELSVPVYFLNGVGGAYAADAAAIARWEPYPGAPASATRKGDLALIGIHGRTWGAVQSPWFDLDLDRRPIALLDVRSPSPTWWFKLQLEGHDPWYIQGDTTQSGPTSIDLVGAVSLLQPQVGGLLHGRTRARLILGPSGKDGAVVEVRSLRVIYQR